MKLGIFPSFRILFSLTLFGVFLVILRSFYAGGHYHFFLWWNLFLASVPYFIATFLHREKIGFNRPLIFIPSFILWLIFLPNAPYVITDLLHLEASRYSFVWYDTLMILSFAISGLILGFQSLRMMSEIIAKYLKGLWVKLFVSVSMFASGFGMYLGRYHRFNSWELIHHPMTIINEIGVRILHPLQHPRAWGMTILTGIFLHILYYGILRFTEEYPREVPTSTA